MAKRGTKMPTKNPLGLTHEEARRAFNDIFFDEVESAFTADIACCDSCYDEFVALWPRAPSAANHEFERNQIGVQVFYEGSRLETMFTAEEFAEFSGELKCPRCGEPLAQLSGFEGCEVAK